MAFATEIPGSSADVHQHPDHEGAEHEGDIPLAHSEHRPVGEIPRTGGRFEVISPHQPAGDQPTAIAELERRLKAGEQDVVLLGATGTGKSATPSSNLPWACS